MVKTKNNILLERGLIGLIIIAILLTIFNFAHNRSLYCDEVWLSLSIVKRPYLELLAPLDYGQSAPIGFLFVTKFFTTIFGDGESSLRLFSLIAFLASIPLFYQLTNKLTKSTTAALLATAIFSSNLILIDYSATVKQYSIDVFSAILILLSALNYIDSKTRRNLLLVSLIGVIAIWCSHIAAFVLFTAGLYILFDAYRTKSIFSIPIVLIFLSWLTSFSVFYFSFVHGNDYKDHFVRFWHFAFVPENLFSIDTVNFLALQVDIFFRRMLQYSRFWLFPLVLTLVGIFALLRKNNRLALFLLIFPFFVHLGVAYFKLYPFYGKFVLYLIPLLIILFSIGIIFLYDAFNKTRIKIHPLVLLLPALINFYPTIRNLPMEHEEVSKSLTFVNEHLEQEDEVFVEYATKEAIEFYQGKFDNLKNREIIFWGSDAANYTDLDKYEKEILKLSKTSWLVFTHVNDNRISVVNHVLQLLKSKGYSILEEERYVGSTVLKVEKPF